MTRRALSGILVAVSCAVVSCHEGDGSDIGPKLAKGPQYDYRVLVQDDASRPVVSARVSIAGGGSGAATAHTGRAFLHEFHSGNRMLTVDGTNAAADDSSRLPSLTVAANLPSGDELPYVFYLPDHGSSVGLTLSSDNQISTSVLDDSARSGAILTVNPGEVAGFGGAASVELRTGRLSVGHLPSTLTNGGAPLLSSRGIFIHPAAITFQNGATLSIPNDMGLAASQVVNLFWLDPATGLWVNVGTATESGGRIVAAAPSGLVQTGGLYAFGVSAATTTVVSGRVLDADLAPIPGVLVRGPQASTRTTGDGRFVLPAMARTTGSGTDRTVTIEFHGGRNYLPTATSSVVSLSAAAVVMPTVTLATRPATNLRLLLVNRGGVVPNRFFRVSGREQFTDSEDVIGSDGVARLEEVATDVLGYVNTVPRNIHSVFRTRSLLFLTQGLDNASSIFSDEFGWRQGLSGGTLLESVDKFGTGALHATHVITGDVPGLGYAGQSDLNGLRGVGVPRQTVVTTVMRSELGNDVVYSAFGMLDLQDGRYEMPSERVRRRFGAFRRFGMVAGSLTNTGSANTRQAWASGHRLRQQFLDEVLYGRTAARRAPRSVLPTAASPAWRLGMPAGPGYVAGAEGTTTAGVFTLERLGMAAVTATEGSQVGQDVPLLLADTPFTIRNAFVGRDTAIPVADFGFDLAGDLGGGLVADLARGVGGSTSVVVNGADAGLRLPPLLNGLSNYVAVFGGTNVAGGITRKQHSIVELDGTTITDVPLLGLPVVTTPTAGATVSGGGFSVGFSLPAECHYGVVQLRSTAVVAGKNEVRDWTVVVPRRGTAVKFFDLPPQAPDVLVAGRTWTLTVSAARIGSGLIIDPRISYDETYLRVLSNWVGMSEADRQENGLSSVSFTVTTN